MAPDLLPKIVGHLLKRLTMPEGAFRRIAAAEALAFMIAAAGQQRSYRLFDTRDAGSYARGHLAQAEPLAERDLGRWIGVLPRTEPVLIYCYHGNASQVFAKTFADFGYTEVYSIDGGFQALTRAVNRARAALPSGEDTAPAPSAALLAFMAEEGCAAARIRLARRFRGLDARHRFHPSGRASEARLVAKLAQALRDNDPTLKYGPSIRVDL